jgi:ubiquinone/menaquinone biosynthesis C-methylase UbiE
VEQDEYERMAASEEVHWWYDATRRLLRDQLGPLLPAGGRFLDAGGGTGATGAWLAEYGDLVTVDIEPAALARYRRAHGAARGFVVADLAQLPLASGSFDAALCVTVLYHAAVSSPAAAMREVVRVVRPGGVVAVLEPGVRRLRRAHDRQTHADRRFSRGDLVDIMDVAGVEVERATGAYTFLVPAAAALAVMDRAGTSSDLDRGADGFHGVLPALARVERAALRRARAPFGLSVLVVGRVTG